MENKLVFDKVKRRFELNVEGQIAFIDYKLFDKNVMCLTHTLVPKALEGKGYAKSIVEKTLNYIKDNHYTLAPLCPFVRTYLKRHPEWNSIVVEGYDV
jgi:hypothetical protein